MAMNDDVIVLRDEATAYDDGTVARVRILSVPRSERFPEGVKYAFHYGRAGAEHPFIRLDNHHGRHEIHLSDRTHSMDFPGLTVLYRAWRSALPFDKREDW